MNLIIRIFSVTTQRIEVEMKIKTPIQAVIFDFDGTLADTRSSTIQCFWEVLNRFNISIPKDFSMEKLVAFRFSIPSSSEESNKDLLRLSN